MRVGLGLTGVGWALHHLGATTVGGWMIVFGVCVLLLRTSSAGRRVAVGHSHGAGSKLLKHEGAHITGAESTPGGLKYAEVGRDWGEVHLRHPERMSSVEYMAFMKAGEAATGGGIECSGDRRNVAAEKKRMRGAGKSPAEIRRAERDAAALARRWASSPATGRNAERLGRRGRL